MLGNLSSKSTKLTGHGTLIKTKRRFYVFLVVRRRRRYELTDRQTDRQTQTQPEGGKVMHMSYTMCYLRVSLDTPAASVSE